VVDDDDDVREVTQLTLEIMGGWDVVPADCGATALRLAREVRPDVVLLDVMMPGMDGPTVFLHLRRDPLTAHIPVVLLTAKVRVGSRSVGEDLDVAGVISKPFDPSTLSQQVDALVAAHLDARDEPAVIPPLGA
jgi:CheY-like chemotaxis protein